MSEAPYDPPRASRSVPPTALALPPVSETLPLPPDETLRVVKLTNWVHDGAFTHRRFLLGTEGIWLGAGGITLFIGLGTLLLVAVFQYWSEVWIPGIVLAAGTPVFLYGAFITWQRGTFTFVFSRHGCEPGTAILTVLRRGKPVHHDFISWRDVRLTAHNFGEPKRGPSSAIVLDLSYAWPPQIIKSASLRPAMDNGLLLAFTQDFVEALDLLSEMQFAAGRPENIRRADAIYPAIDDTRKSYVQWYDEGDRREWEDALVTREMVRSRSKSVWLD